MPKVHIKTSVGLRGRNSKGNVTIVQKRLIELGFDWLVADGRVGPQTINAIRLFQAIKNGFDKISNPKNDGLIEVGKSTHLWLEAKNAPRWQMMPPGSKQKGYVNIEVTSQTFDHHDFGTNWLAETLEKAGASYKRTHLKNNPKAALLTINDASMPRGGNTPDHYGHETGLVCDMRLPRKNGTATGGTTVFSSAYDRKAMRAMLKALKKQTLADRILLNDATLQREGLCRAAHGHHNHVHFEIKPPLRQKDS